MMTNLQKIRKASLIYVSVVGKDDASHLKITKAQAKELMQWEGLYRINLQDDGVAYIDIAD